MQLLVISTAIFAFSTVTTEVSARSVPRAGNPTFWHLTDMHYDQNYSATAGDTSKMCWNLPDGNNVPLGEYGDYSCDAPRNLLDSVLRAMSTIQPTPDFIVWTGDDTSHVDNVYFSVDKVVEVITLLTTLIKDAFPTTNVVPVLGNHDNYPKHWFSPNGSDLYDRVADLWKDWLQEGYETFKIGGYYSKALPSVPSIKAIGLNTPLYYEKNKLVAENNPDPAGQFAWLESQLTDASVNGYKVYIVAHVPTGVFERKVLPEGFTWMRPQYNKKLNAIIVKYASVIAGQFFGHHHTDSFKVFYNEQGVPVSYTLIAPAVTPWNTTLAGIGPNNPGVRLFEYDNTDGRVLNFQQYYLKLGDANTNHLDNWVLEYDFLEAFRQSELSAASLHNVAQSFYPNSPSRTLFDKYFLYNSVSYVDASICDSTCQLNHYCAITKVDYDEFRACNGANHIDTHQG